MSRYSENCARPGCSAVIRIFTSLAMLGAALVFVSSARAEWPTYRGDARRSGVASEALQFPLAEAWRHQALHAPEPAWPPPARQNIWGGIPDLSPTNTFDRAFHTVISDGRVYYGSSADDAVRCLDLATGSELWAFATEGPVRLAPTIVGERLYFGSDDGYVYCLRTRDGGLVWQSHGAPRERRLPGNGRMISLWPIRSGVAVDSGVLYASAGFFPMQGVYLLALDTRDGSLLWRRKIEASPQGYLLASDKRLYLPTGRTAPLAFSREDGEPLGGVDGGGCFAIVEDDMVVSGPNEAGDLQISVPTSRERIVSTPGLRMVVTGDHSIILRKDSLCMLDRRRYLELSREITELSKIEKEKRTVEQEGRLAELAEQRGQCTRWEIPCAAAYSLVVAGDAILAGGDDEVLAYGIGEGKLLWSGRVDGKAHGLALSDGRLLVSTDKGAIHCFAPGAGAPPRRVETAPEGASPYPSDAWSALYESAAEKIAAFTDFDKGYCFVIDSGEGRLAYEIAKRTDMRIVGVEQDPERAAASRRTLARTGLYGTRIAVHCGSLDRLLYAPCVANLIVSDEALSTGQLPQSPEAIARILRPCGGSVLIGVPTERTPAVLLQAWGACTFSAWQMLPEEEGDVLRWATARRDALKGAGEWTHQYADASNTACSRDTVVEGPTDLQWFGQPGPHKMADRHHRGVGPLSKDGRLFVPGNDYLAALDAYNGTVLWEREIPESARMVAPRDCGSMALADDRLYLAAAGSCLALDVATGETKREFSADAGAGAPQKQWGYVACAGDMLLGSATRPGAAWRKQERATIDGAYWDDRPMVCSDALFAFERRTGKRLWTYAPRQGVIVNPTIAVAGSLVIFVESANPATRQVENGRVTLAELVGKDANLVALDARSGETAWSVEAGLRDLRNGIHLLCSKGVVLVSGTKNVPITVEGKEREVMRYVLRGYDASNGARLWETTQPVDGITGGDHGEQDHHPTIVGDTIYASPLAFDLRTGLQNPTWRWERGGHGCGTISTSAAYMFNRGANPQMTEIRSGKQTRLTAATRPGCWINMIPAGGLVLVPEASSGCTCGYSVQASMAFIPRTIQ